MVMLAEAVDAVVGIDTHRDSYEAQIDGKPIATMRIYIDSGGWQLRLLTDPE